MHSVHVCFSFRCSYPLPLSSTPASPDLFKDYEPALREPLIEAGAWVVFRCMCRPWTEPRTSPVGLSLADYWDHSSDAESGAVKSSSKRRSGPSGAADHPPAPDQRPGPDHRHGHREPDPASDQHPGHHALPHQARSAGKGSVSRQLWLPGHLSWPPFFCFFSMKSHF